MRVGVVGSGQVAQHLVDAAKTRGIDVVLIGRKGGPAPSKRKYAPDREYVELGDLIALVKDLDVTINTAAFRDLMACQRDSNTALAINATLPTLLSSQGPRQVFISTDYVFKGLQQGPRRETEQPDAVCNYGASKIRGEYGVLDHGGSVVRIASPWGIFPSPERPHFVDAIIPKGVASGNLDMPLDQVFSPTYLPDVAPLILDVALDPKAEGVYHAVNSGRANWQEFTKFIFETIRTKVKVTGSIRNDHLRPKFGNLMNDRLPRQRTWPEAMVEYLNGNRKAEDLR